MDSPRCENKRIELWRKLLTVIESIDAVWCFFGDFNEVGRAEERLNCQFSHRGANAFNKFIG